jgi:lipoate-protein ligase A
MNTPTCRLYPLDTAAGAWQMAADEVLLEEAATGRASLRLYVWSEATLSLGYFQSAASSRSDSRLARLPLVRRASGGEALVHHREVTYALALPAGPPWQPAGQPWIPRMHTLIRQALADLGVETRACTEEKKLGEVLCFLHHTPSDLLVGSNKVVGSAQRKQRGAILQHGGILLAQSPHTPALPGIAELSGKTLSPADLADAIQRQVKGSLGWWLVPAEWSEEQQGRIEELIHIRYAYAGWSLKR